jgi:hypothetical protein
MASHKLLPRLGSFRQLALSLQTTSFPYGTLDLW